MIQYCIDMSPLWFIAIFVAFAKANFAFNDQLTIWYQGHYEALTDNIQDQIEDPDHHRNSILTIFGKKAFPVWLNIDGDVKVAGAEFGSGRVLAGGENDWFEDEISPSLSTLVTNAVNWLTQGKESPRVACFNTRYSVKGFPCQTASSIDDLKNGEIDLIYFKASSNMEFDELDVEIVLEFVRNGGGLIMAGQAINWNKIDNDDKLPYATGFPANR